MASPRKTGAGNPKTGKEKRHEQKERYNSTPSKPTGKDLPSRPAEKDLFSSPVETFHTHMKEPSRNNPETCRTVSIPRHLHDFVHTIKKGGNPEKAV